MEHTEGRKNILLSVYFYIDIYTKKSIIVIVPRGNRKGENNMENKDEFKTCTACSHFCKCSCHGREYVKNPNKEACKWYVTDYGEQTTDFYNPYD